MNKDVKIPIEAQDTLGDVVDEVDAICALIRSCNDIYLGDITRLGDVISHLLDPLRRLIAMPSGEEEETA